MNTVQRCMRFDPVNSKCCCGRSVEKLANCISSNPPVNKENVCSAAVKWLHVEEMHLRKEKNVG